MRTKIMFRVLASVAVAAGVASFFGTGGGGGGGDPVGAGAEGPTQTAVLLYCPTEIICYPWLVQWHTWGKTNGTAVNESLYRQQYLEHGVYVEGFWDLPFWENVALANQTDVTHGQPGQRQTEYNINTPDLSCRPTLNPGDDVSWCESTSLQARYIDPSYKTTGRIAGTSGVTGFDETEVRYAP